MQHADATVHRTTLVQSWMMLWVTVDSVNQNIVQRCEIRWSYVIQSETGVIFVFRLVVIVCIGQILSIVCTVRVALLQYWVLTTGWVHEVSITVSRVHMFPIIAVVTALNQMHPGIYGPVALSGINHFTSLQSSGTVPDRAIMLSEWSICTELLCAGRRQMYRFCHDSCIWRSGSDFRKFL